MRSKGRPRRSGPGSDRSKTGPTPSRREQAASRQFNRHQVQRADPGLAAKSIADALIDISGRRPVQLRSPQQDELCITVATGPADTLTLGVEERLVRAALLYADHVTLVSPGAFMLDAAASL